MTLTAIVLNNHLITWNAIIVAIAAAVCFCMTAALFTANGGKLSALWLLLPLSIVLSLPLARILHWYCHSEQYASFASAMSDYGSGKYCLPGVIAGTALAAVLVRLFGLTQNLPRLYDCLAPGAALGIALIRFSEIFTASDRGKAVVTDPRFQRLPFSSEVVSATGPSQWRMATFFLQFLLMMLVFVLVLRFFLKRRRWPMKKDLPRGGHVALLFLGLLSAVDLVLDSSRYDASFLRLNGFVSMVQIFSAVTLLAVLAIYSRRSISVNGLRGYHIALWLMFLLAVAGTGVMEYLVQRYGNSYLSCYLVMSLTSGLMALSGRLMYRSVCGRKRKKRTNGPIKRY